MRSAAWIGPRGEEEAAGICQGVARWPLTCIFSALSGGLVSGSWSLPAVDTVLNSPGPFVRRGNRLRESGEPECGNGVAAVSRPEPRIVLRMAKAMTRSALAAPSDPLTGRGTQGTEQRSRQGCRGLQPYLKGLRAAGAPLVHDCSALGHAPDR